MDEEFHPQLTHLVDDDEEHLIMLLRQAFLRSQEPVEAQISAIGHGVLEVPVDVLTGNIDTGLELITHDHSLPAGIGSGSLRFVSLPEV